MQTKRRLLFSVSLLFVFCAATAIASPAQMFTTLVNFNGPNGSAPQSALVQGTDGNFYGTTVRGGTYGYGTVFKMTPSGTLTTIYSFCSQGGLCVDGFFPYAGLIQATDGNFYGTTSGGGVDGAGTVFRITPTGTLTTLHNFCSQAGCADGADPNAGLVQATDGNFYGTAVSGGAKVAGTVFKITPSGNLTTLYSFCSQQNCADGALPYAGLVQATDGNLYGTNITGGSTDPLCGSGCGTVFKITLSGTLTTVHTFDYTDGTNPNASLVQASDGNLYGTATGGGVGGGGAHGVVYKITLSGTLTVLYNFCSQLGCTDGAGPEAGLVQATDGNFYGTTESGGSTNPACGNGCGTVFKITPSGVLTTLHTFEGVADGGSPVAGLVQATDGNFYGTTSGGGSGGFGTVFELHAADYTLTILPTGNGMVTSTDGFINCPGTCSHTYPSNTPVTLNAAPGQGWVFGGWNGACFGTGSCTLTMTQSLTLDAIFSQALQFVAVTPCRLVDTRPDRGGSGPIQGGTFQSFPIPQEGGCNIPTTAAAYSLNVSVVPQGPLGYLTIWPAGENRPVVATLNSLDGRIKADAAIVPAGTNGAVSVYVTQTTNVILDINGYFAPASGSTLAFYPLPPCRVADTRKSTFPPGLGPPFLSGLTARDFPVLASNCPIPSSAQAYSLNLSAVPYPSLGNPLGYLEVWPKDQMPSNPVSTLNNLTGTVVANAALVPAGTSGDITVFPSNDTDLVIDINGYFAPAGPGGLSLYPAAPCRVIDTRQIGTGQPFSGLLSPPVDVEGSVCEPPSTAQAYVFNATVVPFGALGYLTLWQNDPTHQPVVSTLNALDGWITNNMAIVPTADGKIDAYASGITQLILDLSSYFAP